MDKKITLIIFLAISLSFCTISFAETVVLKSGKTVEGKIIEKTDEYIKIYFQGVPVTYFLDEIERIDEPSPVSSIVTSGGKKRREPNELEWCYYDIVLQTKSPELCYKISPKAVYDAAFSPAGYQIYYWRSQCFSDVAGLIGEVKLCDEVKTISTRLLNGDRISRNECIANVSNSNKSIPGGATCYNAELLLKTMGYNENNIPERFVKNGYGNWYGFYLEIFRTQGFKNKYDLLPDFSKETNGSEELNIKEEQDNCKNIDSWNERGKCYTEAALKKNDVNICEKIDNQYLQARCIAVLKKDESICQRMPDEWEKSSCYKDVAMRKQDVSLCGKITDDRISEECYAYFAKKNHDISLCNNVSNQQSYQNQCYNEYYAALAIERKDLTICDSIKEQSGNVKRNCYRDYAIETKDESVCDKLEPELDKWMCHKELGNKSNYKNEPLDNLANKIKELMKQMEEQEN